jgi:carbon storage regulator
MLILTRRTGEEIVVGDEELTIVILGVKGNQVRVGIATKLDVALHRREVFDSIKRNDEPVKSLVHAVRKFLQAA